jgi:hypothetical protein
VTVLIRGKEDRKRITRGLCMKAVGLGETIKGRIKGVARMKGLWGVLFWGGYWTCFKCFLGFGSFERGKRRERGWIYV